jgi:two-component system, LytTR family, sensor kinase
VLAVADVLDLFVHELAGLRRRRLPLPLVLSCFPNGLFLGHDAILSSGVRLKTNLHFSGPIRRAATTHPSAGGADAEESIWYERGPFDDGRPPGDDERPKTVDSTPETHLLWCEEHCTMAAVPPAPDLRHLTRIALGYVLVWCLIGLFDASQSYRVAIALGDQIPPWQDLVFSQLRSSFLWALLTPLVVAVGERLPFQHHRLRDSVLLILSVPLLAVARVALGGILLLIERGPFDLSLIKLSIAAQFHGNVVAILVVLAITRLVCSWNESRKRERHAAELTATLVKARVDELRTRLQPDFLAQSLQIIGTRIRADDPSSDTLIVGLSDLLRRAMALVREDRITLEGELDLLDRYLRFQELLSGRRIESRFELDEALLAAEVPLMLLQPLLNEAIAGATCDQTLRITVRGHQEGPFLHLEVEDDGQSRSRGARIGVQERVRSYFDDARVEARTHGMFHTTFIYLPLAMGSATS